MAAVEHPARVGLKVMGWTVLLCIVGALAWATVYLVMLHHKGVYAGVNYSDGRYDAANALAYAYGHRLAAGSHMGTPDVVNTHLGGLLQGNAQVRVFHIIGPRGVKYCVSVWDSGWQTNIVKGCTWARAQ